MRALFDLKHPAQVRFFEPVVRALTADGDEVLVTSRAKDETLPLLANLGIEHVCLSRMARGHAGMAGELAIRAARMARLARRFRPHVLVARTGVTIGLVGALLRIPRVSFDDTEFASLQLRLSGRLSTIVCTGMGYDLDLGSRQVRFAAPPHLMYTHPSRFHPDRAPLREGALDPAEPPIVVRLKAWRALHDSGVRGPEESEVRNLLRALCRHARPVISSERPLPPGLRRWQNPLAHGALLHLLAAARLYVGEGSCMAAEAACLGTPAIFVSPSSRRGYLDALESRYGIVRTVRTMREGAELAEAWLADPQLAEHALAARRRLLQQCPDPLDFAVNIIRRVGADREPPDE